MLMRFYVASAYGFLFILSSVYLSVNCTLNHSSMLILKGRHGYYEYRFFILDWIQSHLRCGHFGYSHSNYNKLRQWRRNMDFMFYNTTYIS